jgi:multiple sugar transport system substrate-binding protein
MWVRQTTTAEDLLQEFVDAFNAGRTGLPIKIEYAGNYGDIYRKVSASIQAGQLPCMAVAYESMTTEYALAGAVHPLDAYVNDPETGYTPEALADFFPGVLETNRYEALGGGMYSFPFSKAVLLMYFNRRVMESAGLTETPRTWDEFLKQCRTIKRMTGKYAYAIDLDCSTISGFIFSMGGGVVRDSKSAYASSESIQVFQLLRTLVDEDLAYLTPPRTFEDRSAFAQGDVAFIFRSSAHQAPLDELMQGDRSAWGVATLPQINPDEPHTVLYGPNVCIFDIGEEQTRTAWEFIRFFMEPENNVRWSLGTGYLPVRKSAAALPEMQRYWDEWEYNRVAFDNLAFARAEPNVSGWQEVRGLVEATVKDLLTGLQTPDAAAKALAAAADARFGE